MKSRLTYRRGFTLVELLVVIAIIGTFATFGIVGYSSVRKTGRDTKRKSELKQYQNAVEVYGVKNNNIYPIYAGAGGTAIATGNLCGATVLNLPVCPKDPQTPAKEYMYQSDAVGSSYVFWAELEKPEIPTGGINYFVVCSNGISGIGLETDGDIPPAAAGVCPTLN